MSSNVLENKIPHSILFSREPLHLLPLKVFGSTRFFNNFCPDLDKLFARSHPLLIAISFMQMSPLQSLLFILSLYLLQVSLYLIKYTFRLTLIILLCLLYLRIPLLFKFTIVVRLPILH